jgi:hypothetical protein
LVLVQRVLAELGIDAEVRTILITNQAEAEQARFAGSPTVRVDGGGRADVSGLTGHRGCLSIALA